MAIMVRKLIKGALSIGFISIVCWYIIASYFGHLHFLEQLQLFLLTGDYFVEYITCIEGLADYLGQATVQFFGNTALGAFLIALLLCVLQLLIAWIYKLLGKDNLIYYSLSFLPPVTLSFFLLNHQALLTLLWSLLLTASFIVVYIKLFASSRYQLWYVLLSAALLFWMGGGATLIYLVFVAAYRLFVLRDRTTRGWIITAVYLFEALLLPLLLQYVTLSPLESLWTGIGYLNVNGVVSPEYWLTIGTSLVTLMLAMFLPKVKSNLIEYAGCAVLVILISIWWVTGTSSRSERIYEEQMRYDYWVRMEQWNKIIEHANDVPPFDQMSAACLNLALAEKNRLPECLFNYHPNHPYQLLNDIHYNYFEPHYMGEIYFRLGFVNTAQRFSDEAMSLMNNRMKSVRSFQRLAETNIIKGRYDIARKYLLVLQHTFAYKKWAEERLSLLNDENAIENHPLYGKLRRFAPQTNYLEVEKTLEERLNLMVKDHPDNLMARHYYLCWLMLNKSVYQFPQALMSIYTLDEKIPTAYQEAFLFSWTAVMQREIEDLPLKIDEANIDRMLKFAQLHRRRANPVYYDKTYWYYQFYVKPQN